MTIKKLSPRLTLLLLFLFCYLLFLLATFPAAQLLPRLPLPAGMQLHNISGTVWQGQIGELRWQKRALHDVQWEVLFSRLWLGMPTVKLSLQDPEIAIASATVGWRGDWKINDLTLKTPASVLQQQIPYPLPAEASGTLQLNISHLSFNNKQCLALEGQAEWLQAQLLTPAGELVLGNPQAKLSCRNNELEINIRQDSAALRSQAQLQLNMQGLYKLQATLYPGNELPADLRTSLNWLGTSDSEGAIRIKNEGRWNGY